MQVSDWTIRLQSELNGDIKHYSLTHSLFFSRLLSVATCSVYISLKLTLFSTRKPDSILDVVQSL